MDPYIPPSPRYGEALVWASDLHRDQRRKGNDVPYISHLIAVSALVWEDDGNEDQAIAGLLHDAIEDAHQTQASIAERFGAEVGAIVQECSDTDPSALPGASKPPWIERKQAYIAGLSKKPEEALLVTAADKVHNARDIVIDAIENPNVWTRFTGKPDGTVWYYWSLREKLQDLLPRSRSVRFLAEAVEAMLDRPELRSSVPKGEDIEAWVGRYLERPETHPKK